MCECFAISRSSYYDWLSRKPSNRSLENEELTIKISEIYTISKCRYGSPKITRVLRDKGIKVSRPRVARIMKSRGWKSIIRKRYRVSTTDSNHGYSPSQNLLNRSFHVSYPGKVWISDITYIRVKNKWLYLTIVMDLYDRKIIGWSLSSTMTTEDTINKAWKMALTNRSPEKGMIFHSDRGIQYASNSFRKLLHKHKITQSMSRKGNCWDNAVAESFFKILKSECVNHQTFSSSLCAKKEIFYFIEVWYNKQRIHSHLNYQTPNDFGENIKLSNVA